MRTTSRVRAAALAIAAVLIASTPARALEPGGTGSPQRDCIVEYGGFMLNYPPPPAPKRREFRCFDGDPSCDTDGTRNGSCAFSIQMCFAGDNVPGCTAGTVSTVRVKNPRPPGGPYGATLSDGRCASTVMVTLGTPSGKPFAL